MTFGTVMAFACALGFANNIRIVWRDCHTASFLSMRDGWPFIATNGAVGVAFVYLFGWQYT